MIPWLREHGPPAGRASLQPIRLCRKALEASGFKGLAWGEERHLNNARVAADFGGAEVRRTLMPRALISGPQRRQGAERRLLVEVVDLKARSEE